MNRRRLIQWFSGGRHSPICISGSGLAGPNVMAQRGTVAITEPPARYNYSVRYSARSSSKKPSWRQAIRATGAAHVLPCLWWTHLANVQRHITLETNGRRSAFWHGHRIRQLYKSDPVPRLCFEQRDQGWMPDSGPPTAPPITRL